MSGYGFGRRAGTPNPAEADEPLDLSGIKREPMPTDPTREAAALERGAALGFVERAEPETAVTDTTPRRRRKAAPPQGSVYVKGPKETIDWFVEFTNQRGHRSYWQTIQEFRAMIEGRESAGGGGT